MPKISVSLEDVLFIPVLVITINMSSCLTFNPGAMATRKNRKDNRHSGDVDNNINLKEVVILSNSEKNEKRKMVIDGANLC